MIDFSESRSLVNGETSPFAFEVIRDTVDESIRFLLVVPGAMRLKSQGPWVSSAPWVRSLWVCSETVCSFFLSDRPRSYWLESAKYQPELKAAGKTLWTIQILVFIYGCRVEKSGVFQVTSGLCVCGRRKCKHPDLRGGRSSRPGQKVDRQPDRREESRKEKISWVKRQEDGVSARKERTREKKQRVDCKSNEWHWRKS